LTQIIPARKGFHDAESLVNVAGPDGAGETVRSVVGDFDGVGFAFERNDGSDGAEDFFAEMRALLSTS
jgi:hypothetical protein